ncbi:MAG: tRNA (adenosine(37)-N6)-threonylcarbamoyltransferase complex ATPase subunit type 1 TsaE [Steroidobacteraceae bacterium]|jgi:tRNA threonylcarbamoyladenosine biosynthesis protein TsaE
MSFTLPDAAATERLGAALGRTCPWNLQLPRAIYLKGELGAGKTTLARGLLRSLGVSGPVRSPSYALIEPYSVAAGTVIHVDLYRVHDAAETEALGLRDEFRGGALILLEWPERAGGVLPLPDLQVTLQSEAAGRLAEVLSTTLAGQAWIQAASAIFKSAE